MSEPNEATAEAGGEGLHDSNMDAMQNETTGKEILARQADEDPGDDAAAATDEGEGQAPKPKKTAQERIDEVTRARREAERQADDARREAEFWRAQAVRTQPKAEAEPEGDAEPDPSAYEHGEMDVRFIRDHATYHARKTYREESAREAARSRTQTALQAFEQRVSEQYPDGEPAGLLALRRAPHLPEPILDLITTSDIGPKLADHLGSNPREFQRISALPPHRQGAELAKLELKLASPPAPTAKTATDAPAPTPQVRGSGGRFTVAPDTEDYAAFQATYGAKVT